MAEPSMILERSKIDGGQFSYGHGTINDLVNGLIDGVDYKWMCAHRKYSISTKNIRSKKST